MKSIQRRLSVSLAVSITIIWVVAMAIAASIISHELGEAADSALRATASQLMSIVSTEDETTLRVHVDGGAGVGRSGSAGSADGFAGSDSASIANPSGVESEPVSPVIAHDTYKPSENDDVLPSTLPPVEFHDKPLHEELSEIDSLLGFVVTNAQGAIVSVGGHSLPPQLYEGELHTGFSTHNGYRVYVESTADGQRNILIADPIDHRTETIHKGLIVLAYTLPFLIPLSLLSVWWIVNRSMCDLRKVQLQIESRGSGDLNPLETDYMPRELKPIGESVNHLLARMSQALESERNFATNSAHELRTPIASALLQTQRQIASLPEGGEKERARQIEKTLQGLARLSEKLMQMARAESGTLVKQTSSNAYPVIEYLVEEYRAMQGGQSRLHLHYTSKKQFDTRLDADGVAILLRNLIDNALKYGNEHTQVDVVVDSAFNRVRVINDGPVIPADELVLLKQRFKRGTSSQQYDDSSRNDFEEDVIEPDHAQVDIDVGALQVIARNPGTSGSGLGLAIVETITRLSAMELSLYSPARGRNDGFEATLRC